MLNSNFVYIGVILIFLTEIDYIIDTVKGKIKPNRVTWFLWTLIPLMAFFAEIYQGVGIESLLTFIFGFNSLLIFISTFLNKNSYWKLGRIDFICGLLSLLGLILWLITKTGNIAILFSILADFIAGFPTIIKSYVDPESEKSLLFWGEVIGSILTLLTIKIWTIAEFAYPLYIMLIDLTIAIFITFKIKKLFN